MRNTVKFSSLTFFLAIIFMVASCASPQKFIESGEYDRAVSYSVKKLRGKRNKKVKYVRGLEEAFAKATKRDMQKIKSLEAENTPQSWGRIVYICADIDARQRMVEPLLPLVDKEGIKANFSFVNVTPIRENAKNHAIAQLYQKGQKLLKQAQESGDKITAREAYSTLAETKRYNNNYKDTRSLMAVAEELGITHVLFEVQNTSAVVLPKGVVHETSSNLNDLQGDWQQFHREMPQGIAPDYKVVLLFTNIDVGQERVLERQFEETKEVVDGWQYVLDENGNVAKDTLGNDIKEDRWITARAFVTEVFQEKIANVSARLEIRDARNNRMVDSENMSATAVFENYASTYDGDKRALTKDTKIRLGNSPLPFPSNQTLIEQAARDIKPMIRKKMDRSNAIL